MNKFIHGKIPKFLKFLTLLCICEQMFEGVLWHECELLLTKFLPIASFPTDLYKWGSTVSLVIRSNCFFGLSFTRVSIVTSLMAD